MGGVAKKVNNYNLDVRNIFAGSHAEHWWGCSNNMTLAILYDTQVEKVCKKAKRWLRKQLGVNMASITILGNTKISKTP
jgi:hypothetical protein